MKEFILKQPSRNLVRFYKVQIMASTSYIRQKHSRMYSLQKIHQYINYGSQCPRVSGCRKKPYKFSCGEKKSIKAYFSNQHSPSHQIQPKEPEKKLKKQLM